MSIKTNKPRVHGFFSEERCIIEWILLRRVDRNVKPLRSKILSIESRNEYFYLPRNYFLAFRFILMIYSTPSVSFRMSQLMHALDKITFRFVFFFKL